MAEIELRAGAKINMLNQPELDHSLKNAFDEAERAKIRGIKWMRLPELLTGNVASSAIQLGESTGQIVGPRSGYIWSLRRLVVSGLKAGTTPDVVNLYRGTTAGQPLWQFNGNNFGYTFGKLELVLMGGENLALANVGSLTATGTITLSGELVEAPAELMGKLA